MSHVYGNKPETILYKAPNGRKSSNHVLLGTWLEIIDSNDDWYEVRTAGRGPGGWVRKNDVTQTPAFKVFFVDVGQGDGAKELKGTEGLKIDQFKKWLINNPFVPFTSLCHRPL